MKKIILLLLLQSINLCAQNLIKNGNFENGLTDWSGFNNQVLVDDLTNSKVGNVNNGEGSIYQIFTVNPNTTYKFYFNYRWIVGTGNYNITVRVKTGTTDGFDLATINLNTNADQWHQGFATFDTGSNDTTVRIIFYKTNGNRPLRIDNVSVFENNYNPSLIDASTPINIQPNGVIGDWVLEFSDEFNGNELNTNKWYKSVSTTSRAARPELGIDDWWWKTENVLLNNTGELILRATKVDHNTMYCGSIESKGLYEVKYGYLEARIKIAKTAKGNHTAFWLQGSNQGNVDDSAADGAEVDIFESAWVSNTTKAVVHYDGYAAFKKNHTIPYNVPNIHNDEYHTFGLLWTENAMDIYYDGIKVTSTNASKPFPFSTNPENGHDLVPKVEEWLWLSVGASFADGDFVSQPVGILSDAKVDYVRVFKPSTTLGLQTQTLDDSIQIFPNPAKDFFTIQTKFKDYQLSFFDVLGKEIFNQKRVEDSNFKVHISQLPKGLYLLHINHQGKSYKKKISI